MMENSDQTGIKLSTQSDRFSVAPGDKLEINLLLNNQRSEPDQLRVSVEGIPLVWVSAEQQVVLLKPGEQSQLVLTIQPSAPPNAPLGRYSIKLGATSVINPARTAFTQVALTVAGYEATGRVGVLLDGLQFSAVPGEQLEIPVVLINQGLGVDTFRLAIEDLPETWSTIPVTTYLLEPGEVKETVLALKPPRSPGRARIYWDIDQ